MGSLLTGAQDIVTQSKANSGCVTKGFHTLNPFAGNIDDLEQFMMNIPNVRLSDMGGKGGKISLPLQYLIDLSPTVA